MAQKCDRCFRAKAKCDLRFELVLPTATAPPPPADTPPDIPPQPPRPPPMPTHLTPRPPCTRCATLNAVCFFSPPPPPVPTTSGPSGTSEPRPSSPHTQPKQPPRIKSRPNPLVDPNLGSYWTQRAVLSTSGYADHPVNPFSSRYLPHTPIDEGGRGPFALHGPDVREMTEMALDALFGGVVVDMEEFQEDNPRLMKAREKTKEGTRRYWEERRKSGRGGRVGLKKEGVGEDGDRSEGSEEAVGRTGRMQVNKAERLDDGTSESSDSDADMDTASDSPGSPAQSASSSPSPSRATPPFPPLSPSSSSPSSPSSSDSDSSIESQGDETEEVESVHAGPPSSSNEDDVVEGDQGEDKVNEDADTEGDGDEDANEDDDHNKDSSKHRTTPTTASTSHKTIIPRPSFLLPTLTTSQWHTLASRAEGRLPPRRMGFVRAHEDRVRTRECVENASGGGASGGGIGGGRLGSGEEKGRKRARSVARESGTDADDSDAARDGPPPPRVKRRRGPDGAVAAGRESTSDVDQEAGPHAHVMTQRRRAPTTRKFIAHARTPPSGSGGAYSPPRSPSPTPSRSPTPLSPSCDPPATPTAGLFPDSAVLDRIHVLAASTFHDLYLREVGDGGDAFPPLPKAFVTSGTSGARPGGGGCASGNVPDLPEEYLRVFWSMDGGALVALGVAVEECEKWERKRKPHGRRGRRGGGARGRRSGGQRGRRNGSGSGGPQDDSGESGEDGGQVA